MHAEEEIIYHPLDLADSEMVQVLLEELEPESIFHLGANLHQRGIDPPTQALTDTNIITTEAIYQYARKTGAHVVFAATFTEYRPTNVPVDEESLLEPQEFYSLTKMIGSLRAKQIGRAGANIVALRMFTPYGPNMRDGRLVKNAIESALSGEPIMLSSAKVTRDFIFVDDLVDLYVLADEMAERARGEIVNAGSGVATTLEQFGSLVKELCSSESAVEFNTTQALAYDGELWQANIQKAKNLFGWEPKHDLRRGLAETIQWYKNNSKVSK
jgi:nucleoside-diphosphate-sugar epimerase